MPTAGIVEIAENNERKSLLLVGDQVFEGFSFGSTDRSVAGECVFQTGMVGYPESLTDPSYHGQILILTYPLIGNYGVPDDKALANQVAQYFESSQIHIAALVVSHYSPHFSHYLAASSLGDWLKRNGVPGIYGVDTRAITKILRERGSSLGKVLVERELVSDKTAAIAHSQFPLFADCPLVDPNQLNLVKLVSTKKPQSFLPSAKASGVRILVVDVGLKNNQIRCFLNRGAELLVVPWDYDFTKEKFDGLFISNGPGDPAMLTGTIERIRNQLEKATVPVFGICLGHQLMALAAGAKTNKMKFGNRGQNIPCTDMLTGRCYITSQNHGYAVDPATLPEGWIEYFVNANDGSNEGIIHKTLPYFSVQFHPESSPGPLDTEFLFDKFLDAVKACKAAGKLVPYDTQPIKPPSTRVNPKKVLILGSGGLSIGQAGEFDYSGSQAIKALKEENIYTVLINPNIATIQTSKGLADKVYFLPVTPEFVRKVIIHEKPDGIFCTFGGQTALNVGVKLKDEFESLGVKVLGTPIQTIEITEDRELFAQHMASIGERCARSQPATSIEAAVKAAEEIGYPVIVRAAFALGGLGSGFAENKEQLLELCTKAFATSPQVLVERSMKGWKEIEYEVVRDSHDNCITVCNMENFDPLGIHTGDSIVVAPSQTLSDSDYMMLRRTAVNVIRHLGVVGECNIQYALNPESQEYCIIEVNARLSRSSALASKATGYPLAFVAAKLGLGIPLTQVQNNVTKKTIACFEPSLDYCVIKIPRWDLKKFAKVSTKISSSMKSVGEVMCIGRTFEEAIQKAIRSVDYNFQGFSQNDFVEKIDEELANPSDQRLFAIANALHMGYSVEKIWQLTKIDRWFLNNLKRIVDLDKTLSKFNAHTITPFIMRQAKVLGFSDRQIGAALETSELAVRKVRKEMGITPFVKQIDTVAAEFPCYTNYLYMTYSASEHDIDFDDQGVMVLGSGVYRIGSSVEFDWCAVRCIRTLRESGKKTIMVNYNPETVSTDYDEADRLYFENLTLERVLDIYEIEKSEGVVVSMGGQTPNNIALNLWRQNVKILGTSPEMIDNAENRYKFSRMLDKIGVDQPRWKELTSFEEAEKFCESVGYPVLVRPSYVLSGAAMNVVYTGADLKSYLDLAVNVSREFPVVITKFIEEAKEIEMDGVADDGKLVMHVISEHVENAGVHSGDATLILPPQDLEIETVKKIEIATSKIANALNITGPFNIQFIAKNNEIKVIECNVRASRSFPFVSKVMGVDLIAMATKAMIDKPYQEYPKTEVRPGYVAVKVPQFSFSRLAGADPILGVEMASTGEVACFGKDKYEAYLKALISTGFQVPDKNILLSVGSYKEKMELLPYVKKLHDLGFKLFATPGTADFIHEHDIPVTFLDTVDENKFATTESIGNSSHQHLANNMIDLYINLPSKNRFRRPASYMSKGYKSRRLAIDFAIPLITNIKCAKLFVEALARGTNFEVSANDSKSSHRVEVLPGLINVQSYCPDMLNGHLDTESYTKCAIAGGFTTVLIQPFDGTSVVNSTDTFKQVSQALTGDAYCDFALSVSASADNGVLSVAKNASAFHIGGPMEGDSLKSGHFHQLTTYLCSLPAGLPIVAHAKSGDLGSILLLANLYNKAVHVTGVTTSDEINLIRLSKEKGCKLTCDVNVYNLFISTKQVDLAHFADPSDVDELWKQLAFIDCFSVGMIPFASHLAKTNAKAPGMGLEDALPLFLTAVAEGRMTLEDVRVRLYDNPRKIFDIPEQTDSYVEVEIDRNVQVDPRGFPHAGSEWSPFGGKTLKASVHRVVLKGSTVYLDGAFFGSPNGKDISGLVKTIAQNLQVIVGSPKAGRKLDGAKEPLSAMVTQPKFGSLEEFVKPSEPEQLPQQMLVGPIPSALSPSAELKSTILSMIHKTNFSRKHILSVSQFSKADMHTLFGLAQELRILVEREGRVNLMNGKIMCTAFYEPSTRTCSSFESAMMRLGGNVVSINQITSSIAKGESMADTVQTLASYGDVIVMRHPAPGSVPSAAKFSPVPVINAGDGTGEHPTQAFLDVFTIREELGTVNGLTVTMVGDLKNGRTVHSLVKLLSLYHVKLNYVSPASLALPESIKEVASKAGLTQYETTRLDDVIGETDVLYVTRIQKERFDDPEEYEKVFGSYVISNQVMKKAKKHMIVMHPLPRINEIDPEVDFDQRAAYFRQMRYGLYVRMALVTLVCSHY